jgi:site-specific DNA recombinase
MTPTWACKNDGRRYGYYVCSNALQRGRSYCPSRPLPQVTIDQWVLDRLGEVAGETHQKESTFAQLARWDALAAEERQRLLRAWIERVDFDGPQGQATITLLASSRNGQLREHKKGERA